jgi:hypothetical protein
MIGQIRIQAAQIVEDAGCRIQQADMLVEDGDAIGQAADVSGGGLEVSGDQAEQGSFAGAVDATNGDAFGARTSKDGGPNRWRSP